MFKNLKEEIEAFEWLKSWFQKNIKRNPRKRKVKMALPILKLLIGLLLVGVGVYGAKMVKDSWSELFSKKHSFPEKTMVGPKTDTDHPQIIDDADPLKQNVKNLSSEILNFLVDRRRNEPQLLKKDTWHRDTEFMIKYSQETMNQYSIKFAARVLSARESLFSRGLHDEELDRFYKHPTNPIGIRIVGEHLGALAERLQ